MDGKVEFYVFMAADCKLMTEERRKDIENLYDKVRTRVDGIIANNVTFNDIEGADTVGIVTRWIFRDEEALKNFRACQTHLDHLEFEKPALLEKHPYIYSKETQ